MVQQVFGIDCRVIPDPETDTPLVVPAGRQSRREARDDGNLVSRSSPTALPANL
jgi:iron complex transport system ATP-binding protein